MPRIILSEFNTHRLISKPTERDQRFMLDFSRNAASSRAIPFKRMVAQVKNLGYYDTAQSAFEAYKRAVGIA